MKLEAVFLAFGLVTLVRGQVGPDGYTTVTTATCTTTGVNIYAYTDTSAIPYNYMCGGGSGGTALTTVASASVSRWQDCFSYCDTYIGTVGCTGFTFVSSSRPPTFKFSQQTSPLCQSHEAVVRDVTRSNSSLHPPQLFAHTNGDLMLDLKTVLITALFRIKVQTLVMDQANAF
jgi:hypothetical protein